MPGEFTNKQKAIIMAKKTLFITMTLLKWILAFMFIGGFLIGGIVVGYITALVKDEPIRDAAYILKQVNENSLTGFVYFADGTTQVGQLRTDEDRRLANTITEIPEYLQKAFISVEDNRFEDHYGVDFIGTVRAAKQKFLNEDQQTGGSTITQQLARRVFLSLEQTDSRKFKEMFLAMRIERIMTKDDILLAYLNKMPFGNSSSGYNTFGIKAAAKGIFNKEDLYQLNIAQSAYLAGLLKAPSEYSAFTGKGSIDEDGFDKAMLRQKVVLSQMLKYDNITQQEYEDALAFNVRSTLAPTKEKAYTTYPFLMIEAEQRAAEALLMMKDPELTVTEIRSKKNSDLFREAIEAMNRSGYTIYTTIDKQMYDEMRVIASNPENFTKDDPEKGMEQTGAIMINNQTGAILSMMEGRDFYTEQMNHATQMVRQPGSSLKPLAAYIPALETGLIQPGSPIDDVPLILKDGSKGAHIPQNVDAKFHGFLTARQALNQSYNIPALKLYLAEYGGVGIETAWDYAKRMGITSLTEQDYSAQTGIIGGLSQGVSVEEVTNAYSTIPNKGVFNDAFMIEKIVDSEGKIIYQHESKPEIVFSEETAYLITDMLRTVISSGSAGLIKTKFKHYGEIPIYGKTGTTQNNNDVWFVGFTPDVSVGVWTGYDQQAELTPKGKNRSKEIWSLIMDTAIEKKPEWFKSEPAEKPENIVSRTISSISGKIPNSLTTSANLLTTDLFNKKFLPTEEEDMLMSMQVIFYNGFNYIPQVSTPSDFVQEKVLVNRERPMKLIIDEIRETFAKYPKSIPTSKGGKKTPEAYSTPDMASDAPTETDPRVDDGATPPPPPSLKIEVNAIYNISFQPVTQEDVIGYRIYRSTDFLPFSRLEGNVVSTGQDPIFKVAALGRSDSFYITSVDIAGNESAPSSIVYRSDSVIDQNSVPTTDDPNVPAVEGVPVTPIGLSVTTRDDGVGIKLDWNPNPTTDQVDTYNIFFSTTNSGPYALVGTVNDNRFEDISFPTDGWYQITASNSNGESAPTAAVEMKTP
ncbi:MAG: transglycosylase domain-containing protein [Paenibacillaceae bacterium]